MARLEEDVGEEEGLREEEKVLRGDEECVGVKEVDSEKNVETVAEKDPVTLPVTVRSPDGKGEEEEVVV